MTLERPTPQPPDPLTEQKYKVAEIARIFGVGSATVRRWIREGKLHALRMPGERGKAQYRITRSELKRFAEHKFDQEAKKP